MDYKNIIIEKQNHVAIITLNRPPANQVSYHVLVDIDKALDELEADKNIRVLVITGAGDKGFCAGFDVSDAGNADKTPTMGQKVWTRVDRFSKPVIAAINGYAFGGGCELSMACHIRIMVDNPKAKIGLTELNLGIIPGWGGTQRLPRIVGKSKALDMILFAKRLSAAEALAIGLVDKVCADGQALKEALEMAQIIAKKPPIAVRCVLKAVAAGLEKGLDEGSKVELEGTNTVTKTKDAVEGFTAFIEKREPVFTGE